MKSQAQAILEKLQQHPNQWVPMPVLSRAPCKYGLEQSFAVNSRVSDLRDKGYDIDNDTRQEEREKILMEWSKIRKEHLVSEESLKKSVESYRARENKLFSQLKPT